MTRPVEERPQGAPAGYTVKFPSSWWHLDLDPSTRDASIRRRIESQAEGQSGLDREQLDSLIRDTRKTAREAYAQGALQAAGLLGFPGDGSILSATTIVLRMTVPEEETADLSQMLLSAGVHSTRNSVGRGTPANSVEIIELPDAGSAGRMTSVEDIDYFGRATVRTGVHHIVVPVPGSRDFLVISSSTPNMNLLDEFFGVFDAIGGTFRFQGEEEPDGTESEKGK